MSPTQAIICLVVLVAMTLLLGPKAAYRGMTTLIANWTCCTAYILLTHNYAPWAWFWVVDFLSAAALTIHPISKWERTLVRLYMIELGFHGGYALWGRTAADMKLYLAGLDIAFAAQMFTIFIWTGGHGLYRLCCARRWRSPLLLQVLGWASR